MGPERGRDLPDFHDTGLGEPEQPSPVMRLVEMPPGGVVGLRHDEKGAHFLDAVRRRPAAFDTDSQDHMRDRHGGGGTGSPIVPDRLGRTQSRAQSQERAAF